MVRRRQRQAPFHTVYAHRLLIPSIHTFCSNLSIHRLLRESDFVVCSVGDSVRGIINATALGLMKTSAVLIPTNPGHVDYAALYDALAARRVGGAFLDVWPSGCWGAAEECGPPFGAATQPHGLPFDRLENVLLTPNMMEQDDQFWRLSAHLAGDNLRALLDGAPLRGVVRNGSQSVAT